MLLPNFDQYLNLIARAIAKSYIDESYKAQLLSNPKARLQEDCQGCVPPLAPFPDDLLIQFEDSSTAPWKIVPLSSEAMNKAILFFPIPPKPTDIVEADIRAFANSPLTASVPRDSNTFKLACWII